jgi:hypothetical protein
VGLTLDELKERGRVYGLQFTLFRVSEETYFGELFGKLVKQMLVQSVSIRS